MSFQISRIVMYGPQEEIREIKFSLGRLNIITGASKTGKSAIAEIVDYCLGSGDCAIPEGIIRRSVRWYGLVLALSNGEAFVARRAPIGGSQASSEVFFTKGRRIKVPKSVPQSNMNLEVLRLFLAREAGIGDYVHEPPDGQTRLPLAATIRHGLIYCFQQQHEIASKRYLFHKQGEPFVPQAIKDTAPYFLGAVEGDYISKRNELKQLQDKLRKLQREYADAERISGQGLSRAMDLVAECQGVGLLQIGISVDSMSVALELLRGVISNPTEPPELPEPDRRATEALLNERNNLTSQYRKVREELDAAKEFSFVERGASRELFEQKSRLRTIELLPSEGDANQSVCPVCSTMLGEEIPAVRELRHSLEALAGQLGGIAREAGRTGTLVSDLEKKEVTFKEKLGENTRAIQAIQASNIRIQRHRDELSRRALVLGRVTLYLENIPLVVDTGSLRSEIEELRALVEKSESELSPEIVEEKMSSILSLLGSQMARWAKNLHLEHAQFPLRIDFKRLSVVADSKDGPIPMDRMGSGENWVGYHLIAHLGLHSWFVNENRPVPRVLFLDQPSQIYFPSEMESSTQGSGQKENDWVAVTRMYKLIYDITRKLKGGLQVIVTDHADLNQKWFQKAVIERWRDGKKLVPDRWLNLD